MQRLIYAILVLVLIASVASADSVFVYKGAGVTYTVTPDGIASIKVGDLEVAKGSWHTWNAEPWFKLGSEKVQAGEVLEKSMYVLSAKEVRVRQVQKDLTTLFIFSFDGEDVTISARVENTSATDTLTIPAFGGLKFQTADHPRGQVSDWHFSYLQHSKLDCFHPGSVNRSGGSWADMGGYGVGFTPWKLPLTRTMFHYNPEDWNRRESGSPRVLNYIVVRSIPPGGTDTIGMKMRVSSNTDWRHLMEPYRDYYRATFGPCQYMSDHRFICMSCINGSASWISKENPYGFHGGFRRIDLNGGKEYSDGIINRIKSFGGQGVIIWGQGGDDPRGSMYRTDMDVLPPVVDQNLVAIGQRMKAAGLRLGVQTRPGEFTYRATWNIDYTTSIDAEDPAALERLWGRFKNMIDKGCTLFYLDSFGCTYEHVKIMQYLRSKMGPNIQCFSEQPCDALMPYSGCYSECTYHGTDAEKNLKESYYGPWTSVGTMEEWRFMCPGAAIASRLLETKGKIPEGFETVTHFYLRNHYTELVADWGDPKDAAARKVVQEDFVSPDGKEWKR